VDVARYARQIALPEVGPDGQARICAARVAVIGADLAAGTAALYLRAAGVGSVSPLPAERGEGQGEGSASERWRALLADVDLVVRSGFDDDAMAGAAARLGLPVIVVRAQRDVVDMVTFARRPPAPDAAIAAPVAAAAPPVDGPAAVLAGTLAAAEALHILARGSDDATSAPPIRHLRLPLDGREPIVQAIGSPT
jgi:hypothetical protein